MKGQVSKYNLTTSQNLADIFSAMDTQNAQVLAGGTDLMVQYEAGVLPFGNFVDISNIDELKGIKKVGNKIHIGALSTYRDLQDSDTIKTHTPNLVNASVLTGGPAIQNRGTIGGNIINASPAADTPPALLAYGAELVLVSSKGERTVDYASFHQNYKKMDLQKGEILKEVIVNIPQEEELVHYYRKVGTRKAQAISKVITAATANTDSGIMKNVKIAMGSVGPTPIFCKNLCNYLEGKEIKQINAQDIKQQLYADISPIDDIRSNKPYRLEAALRTVGEFILQCKEMVGNN